MKKLNLPVTFFVVKCHIYPSFNLNSVHQEVSAVICTDAMLFEKLSLGRQMKKTVHFGSDTVLSQEE